MRNYLFSVYVLAQLATPCLAQPVDSAELPPAERREVPTDAPAAAITQLVLGDSYAMEIEQAGVKQRCEGTLVYVDEDWLALRQIIEGRNDMSVPVLSKLPFVGPRFRNIGIGQETVYRWLPRAAVTIKERVAAAESTKGDPISINALLQHNCSIEYAQDGAVKSADGPLTALTDRDLTVTVTLSESRRKSVPVLGKIPVVGRAFTNHSVEITQQSKEIAMNDVLCIRISETELLNDDALTKE